MFDRICALDTCGTPFQTDNPRKMHHTRQCATKDRVRRHRKNKRQGGGPNGGGNGGGNLPQTGDLFATIGGAVEYGGNGSVSDKSGYYVKYKEPRRDRVTAIR